MVHLHWPKDDPKPPPRPAVDVVFAPNPLNNGADVVVFVELNPPKPVPNEPKPVAAVFKEFDLEKKINK